jgi:hypothetical protein
VRKAGVGWATTFTIGFLGLALVAMPDVWDGRVPAGLDSSFNNYILEHGFRWLTRQTASFWAAPFFYPFPLVTAFSVNNLGSEPIYAFLRIFGLPPEDAFRGWYLFGYVANFTACAYVLRRLEHGWLASALGAFLFAFGLPITAQSLHVQLLYRFGVPLAMLSLIRFKETPRLASLIGVGFWTVWQFSCEIYTGYFLALLLVAYIAAAAIVDGGSAMTMLRYWPVRSFAAWRVASHRSRAIFLVVGAILGIMLAALLTPYLIASHIYGFKRTWDEIATMLPRLGSYLLSTNSRLWQFSWLDAKALPMRHEHAMLVGFAPLAAIMIALVLRWRRRITVLPFFATMGAALVLLFLLTLWVEGFSLYRLMVALPGVNSIRGVTRIVVIFLFPVAVLLATSLDALSIARVAPPIRYVARGLIVCLLVFECSDIVHYTSLESDSRGRVQAAAAALPAHLPEAPILLLAPLPNETPNARELDAMWLSQERGWPTLNGYSGNLPPGHTLTGSCEDAPANISAALDFLSIPGDASFAQLANRVVLVGYPPCPPASAWRRVKTFAGPLAFDLMARTEIVIDDIHLVGDVIFAELSIINHGTLPIPAHSSTGTPVRISARYLNDVPSKAELPLASGWELRQDLVADIEPGQSAQIEVQLPPLPKAGTYRVAVSMVQDGVAWFHDHGMPIAVSKQRIAVEYSIRIED